MKHRLLLLLIPFLASACVQEDGETLFLKGILDDPLMAQNYVLAWNGQSKLTPAEEDFLQIYSNIHLWSFLLPLYQDLYFLIYYYYCYYYY